MGRGAVYQIQNSASDEGSQANNRAKSLHTANAILSATSVFRKSVGILCTASDKIRIELRGEREYQSGGQECVQIADGHRVERPVDAQFLKHLIGMVELKKPDRVIFFAGFNMQDLPDPAGPLLWAASRR